MQALLQVGLLRHLTAEQYAPPNSFALFRSLPSVYINDRRVMYDIGIATEHEHYSHGFYRHIGNWELLKKQWIFHELRFTCVMTLHCRSQYYHGNR